MSVIELKDIMKTYHMGDSIVHALFHVNYAGHNGSDRMAYNP